ncbi:hypothetical protein J6590_104218 [Homalodisca vitripennis]|nr:hypothetical protein J6590_104218 [Homalodisca vitripennis]
MHPKVNVNALNHIKTLSDVLSWIRKLALCLIGCSKGIDFHLGEYSRLRGRREAIELVVGNISPAHRSISLRESSDSKSVRDKINIVIVLRRGRSRVVLYSDLIKRNGFDTEQKLSMVTDRIRTSPISHSHQNSKVLYHSVSDIPNLSGHNQ